MTTAPAPLDGLLLVDKPADMTSHDVVAKVRYVLKQKSVGHTGTLDPLATGLLILVLGEATKLSDYLLAADKSYGLKVRLGVTTDSMDRTGKVLTETSCDQLTAERVRAAALALQGDFQWPVPIFSAAKVDGKKLYEHGRAGTQVVIPTKAMKYWDAEIDEVSPLGVQMKISCSKGSFIRTWADELGKKLGVGGIIEELRRLSVGTWDLSQAVKLNSLTPELAREALVPMGKALPEWKQVVANPKEMRLISNGQVPRDLVNRLIFEQKQSFELNSPVFIKVLSPASDLLAILAAEPGQGLKIRRVFRTFT